MYAKSWKISEKYLITFFEIPTVTFLWTNFDLDLHLGRCTLLAIKGYEWRQTVVQYDGQKSWNYKHGERLEMMNLNLVLLFLNIFSFANCTVYFIVQYILFPQLYSLFHYGNCTFFLLWLFVQYIAKCTIYSLMIFIKYILFTFFNCIFNRVDYLA